MTTTSNHQIKVNRALRQSKIGKHPASASAMLRAVPNSVVAKVSSRELAEMLDAMWSLAEKSKAIANSEAISEGAVWDSQKQEFRELV
jgi:hypothetical protein